MDTRPDEAPRGRGTGLNPANRFEELAYDWDEDADPRERPAPKTRFFRDAAKSLLTKNDSPDLSFTWSLNPYRGCEHGCVYCYARPYHEYLGLSSGLDFETKIFVKEDAPRLLAAELSKPSWTGETIALGGVTDCYQPIERKLGLTRRVLEVLADARNPCGFVTKNALVTRDLDVLQELARHGAVRVYLTLTTLDAELSRRLEPRASTPAARLDALRVLAKAGVTVGVMTAPLILGLNDHELPALLEAAADAGAVTAGFVPLRLPHQLGPLFEDWLERHYPDRKAKVLSQIAAIRGGRLNDPRFGTRMRGEGVFADHLAALFKLTCRRLGLDAAKLESMEASSFRRPLNGGQLRLL
ncbi:MAG: PA0069 family radical SAM protein [Elusimicrobiota bacterium]|nr:PA0069 family radical SAM protein [Elusimicrobiota bacterium]